MKIWLKIALNAVRLPKFEQVIVVAEKDDGKRFTATFRAGVQRLRVNVFPVFWAGFRFMFNGGRVSFFRRNNCDLLLHSVHSHTVSLRLIITLIARFCCVVRLTFKVHYNCLSSY